MCDVSKKHSSQRLNWGTQCSRFDGNKHSVVVTIINWFWTFRQVQRIQVFISLGKLMEVQEVLEFWEGSPACARRR